MKTIIINILGVFAWILIGHFFPSFSLMLTAFYLPILFLSVGLSMYKDINMYIYSAICFGLVLMQDYLFRLYGGGIHDDAGRALCEIVFYTTLTTVTIALLCLTIIVNNKMKKLRNENKLASQIKFLNILFVFIFSLITFLLFRQFNIFI